MKKFKKIFGVSILAAASMLWGLPYSAQGANYSNDGYGQTGYQWQGNNQYNYGQRENDYQKQYGEQGYNNQNYQRYNDSIKHYNKNYGQAGFNEKRMNQEQYGQYGGMNQNYCQNNYNAYQNLRCGDRQYNQKNYQKQNDGRQYSYGRYYQGDYYSRYMFGSQNCRQADKISFNYDNKVYTPHRVIFADKENNRCYFNVENRQYSQNAPNQIVVLVDRDTFYQIWNEILAYQNGQFQMDGYSGDSQQYNYSAIGDYSSGTARIVIEPYN